MHPLRGAQGVDNGRRGVERHPQKVLWARLTPEGIGPPEGMQQQGKDLLL